MSDNILLLNWSKYRPNRKVFIILL